MAYNTVSIKRDLDEKPIPQYYDTLINEYKALEGLNGANKTILYDSDGNAIDVTTLLGAITTALGAVDIASSVLPDRRSNRRKTGQYYNSYKYNCN